MVNAVRCLAGGSGAEGILPHGTAWYVGASLLWAAGIVAVFAPARHRPVRAARARPAPGRSFPTPGTARNVGSQMRPRSPAPTSLRALGTRVDERLAGLLDAEVARWQRVDPVLVEPLGALRRLVEAGGKRLRPAFCHWAFVGAGGDPDDPRVVDAGAAFEMLHAFALVHDDVMDGSPTRRGERTAHLAFADAHRAAGWRGEARRFGEGVAILVGDLAHVYADRLLGDVPGDVWSVWNDLRLELNVGQYLDLLGTSPAPTATAGWPTASRATSRGSTRSSARCTSVRRWPAGWPTCAGPCRPTAIPWARCSSSATTCSGRSATRRSPASRWARTCAKASPRPCWPSPPSGPRRSRGPPPCSTRSARRG